MTLPPPPKPAHSPLEKIESGLAPRLIDGWKAMLDVLADGEWHDHMELVQAGRDSPGELADRTCHNLLADARRRDEILWDRQPVHRRRFRYRRPA